MSEIPVSPSVPNVSRETSESLEIYYSTLKKWNPKINLVSSKTLDDAWDRHFLDSMQIMKIANDKKNIWRRWCDLGSGGGFPGMVVAIISKEIELSQTVKLVESDGRKCAFLREVSRACSAPVDIENYRIMDLEPACADVVSARALAPLAKLLEFTEKHRRPDGICLFHKGHSVHKEIEDARANWDFDLTLHSSVTEEGSSIVEIGAFQRAK